MYVTCGKWNVAFGMWHVAFGLWQNAHSALTDLLSFRTSQQDATSPTMEDEFSRKDSSSSMMESQDRRPLPRVVYNDSDVQIFRRCLATYMAGDFQSAATEIRGLRNRYTDIVHIQLNELIINFFLQRCVNTDEFLADMKDAMTKVRHAVYIFVNIRSIY
jgi:hypothetical protein